jgi:thioredoxin 1
MKLKFKTHSAWMLLGLAILSLASCDKAREVVKQLKVPPEKTATSEVPKKMVVPTPPLGPVVVNLESSGYQGFIHKPGALRVVAFHADWCGPCQKLAPVLAKVAAEFGGWVTIGRIDVDRAADLAALLRIEAIPDVRLYRDGAEVARFSGLVSPDAIRQLFDQNTKDLRAPVASDASAGDSGTSTEGPSAPVVAPMDKDWLPPGMKRR